MEEMRNNIDRFAEQRNTIQREAADALVSMIKQKMPGSSEDDIDREKQDIAHMIDEIPHNIDPSEIEEQVIEYVRELFSGNEEMGDDFTDRFRDNLHGPRM